MPESLSLNGASQPPTISVILPVFNGIGCVERAIRSVVLQTFPHWELLAIDDGSTDGSVHALAACAKGEPRIRVLQSKTNGGAAAARNLGLAHARGEIITYLDCLDEYDLKYLEQAQQWGPQADVCLFTYELVEGDAGPSRRSLSWDPVHVWDRMMDANITCPLGIAHRRGLVDRIGRFAETFRQEEDWDLLKRLARAGASFLFVRTNSGIYHCRPGNRVSTRRLADQAWQTNGIPASANGSQAPRLVRYSTKGRESSRAAKEQADVQFAQAMTLVQKGRRDEAIPLLRKVVQICPDHPKGHHNLGVALADARNYVEALASLREALRCQPHYPEAHYCLGNCYLELGRLEEAVDAYRDAVQQKPDFVDALNNRGLALTRLGRQAEAIVFLRQVVRLQPDFVKGHNNLGLGYMEQGDFDAAETAFSEALRLNPRYPDAHTNLGSAYKEQGRLDEAMACYEMALGIEPDAVTPRWNRSLALLQMGNYEQGWAEYEWRWKRKETTAPALSQPRWNGAPLRDRTILLHVEQGLGDMLQFVRYAPLVKKRGGTVIVATPTPLVELFTGCEGIDDVVDDRQDLPPFDIQAPLMSLPAIFETTLSSVPNRVPYINTKPALKERWRQRLESVTGLRVGIAWQGNPRHKWDRFRSFPVTLFESLAALEGVSIVSIQKGVGAEQLAFLQDRFSVIDLGPELTTFTDTAALMQNLDLVICCDTSVAHLAGALGVRTWVALSTIVDWRWLLKREDSPWYPTLRLFRQQNLGDWEPVFHQMTVALAKNLASKKKK